MCRKTKSETNFSQITYQINNFALNLGKAEDACPAMKFFEARCWSLYTGAISNYLAIIIIVKSKNKLMTYGLFPHSKPSHFKQDSKEQFKTTGHLFSSKIEFI